jgi:quinol monooxygenase YgiN
VPVRSLLSIQAKPGMRQHLVDSFFRIDVPGHAMRQDGCLAVELLLPPDPDGPVVVTALWRDRAAYLGWLANPWRAHSTADIAPYVEDEPAAGELFEVVSAPAVARR